MAGQPFVVADRVAWVLNVAGRGGDRPAGGHELVEAHELVALGLQLRDDRGECLGGMGAATIGMHDDDRAGLNAGYDVPFDRCRRGAVGIAGDDVPLDDHGTHRICHGGAFRRA